MKVLIGCEFSGAVRRAFRERGHDAWSCDILPAADSSPYHIQADVLSVLGDGWDMAVFHPPCTYTSQAGYRWFKTQPDRMEKAWEGYEFFMKLVNAPIPKIAVENTRGLLWKWYRRPDQIVHPYYFGDPLTKATCFWLKGLPLLEATDMCQEYFVNYTKYKGGHNGRSRSKTWPGMAAAMAAQWGSVVYLYRQLPLWEAA